MHFGTYRIVRPSLDRRRPSAEEYDWFPPLTLMLLSDSEYCRTTSWVPSPFTELTFSPNVTSEMPGAQTRRVPAASRTVLPSERRTALSGDTEIFFSDVQPAKALAGRLLSSDDVKETDSSAMHPLKARSPTASAAIPPTLPR